MCEECSPKDRRNRSIASAPPSDAESSGPGLVESTVRAELERVDRLATVAGAIAVKLAQRLDSAVLTGSQASSLSGQLLKTMAVATEGAIAPEPDEIDEFTRRAREKKASA